MSYYYGISYQYAALLRHINSQIKIRYIGEYIHEYPINNIHNDCTVIAFTILCVSLICKCNMSIFEPSTRLIFPIRHVVYCHSRNGIYFRNAIIGRAYKDQF